MSKNVKVGLFLVVGALLFAAGLFLIGNHNQVFSHHYDVYTEFANVDTLTSGAKLRVSGMDAGEVSEIDIPKQASAKFRLKLHVDKKFQDIIRQDSVASIETEGMVGDKYVNIAKGSSRSPECASGCTLPSQEPFEMSDLMRQGKNIATTVEGAITDIQHRTDDTISHVDGTIVAMRGNVERIAANGARITDNVNEVVKGVRGGRGTVGALLTNDQMAKNVTLAVADAKTTASNLEQASGKANQIVAQFQQENIPQDVHQTVANARDMSQQLKGAVGNFLSGGPKNQSTAENLRDTIQEADRATRNLASDTEAVKHNFFLRGFFHRRGFYSLQFNPTEYASSEFVKHPAKRVWLSADELFTRTPGSQELSSTGKAALDRAISEVADDLPNNPIMIEGYASGDSAAERYVASSQRATEVKEYLQKRFKINPDLIGTIPLGDKPPARAGKASWDGISIAMVVSRK